MFAVIKTGGKQYKVAKNDVIVVESLAGEAGAMVELNSVLMLGGEGASAETDNAQLDKASVFAEVVEQTRGEKIIVFKKKRRQNYRRKAGHRQNLTVLRILDVSPTGTKPKVAAKKAPAKEAAKLAPEAKEAKKPAAETKESEPKATAEKAPAKKAPAKKAPAKKAAAKKAPAKKAAKKTAAKSKPKSKD